MLQCELPESFDSVYIDLLDRVKVSIVAVVLYLFSGKPPSINFKPKGTASLVAANALARRSNLLNCGVFQRLPSTVV